MVVLLKTVIFGKNRGRSLQNGHFLVANLGVFFKNAHFLDTNHCVFLQNDHFHASCLDGDS